MAEKESFIYNYLGPNFPKLYGEEVPAGENSIIYIYQWGTAKFRSLMFDGYKTVHIMCDDAPDLTYCNSLAKCFLGVKIIGDISRWQVDNIKI